MGTSSMYGGYSNGNSQGNPLLPNDFDENENNNDENNNDDHTEENQNSKENKVSDKNVSWQTAKTSMSKVASGKSTINKAVSNYVKAYGGAKSASKTAKSGIGTIINIGQFVNNVASQGFTQALEKYNIDYIDKSAKDVLSELINYLAPSPITKEDSIARKALIDTMEQLYELLDKENLEIDNINNETLNFIIPKYVECYVYERIINDLGSRIETASLNSTQAIKIEQDIKDYINAKVDIAFKGKDFGVMSFTKNEVESLYNQCYTIMENML
jgi:hypothetical protein